MEFSTQAKPKKEITDLSIDELFKIQPTWRGQRRKKLIATGLEEAMKENQRKKGTGDQQLWEAARVGNFERLMDLLFRSKDYVPSNKDLSHGIHAAAAHGRVDVIELLIRHGADPSDNDMLQSYTPAMHAARQGHIHALKFLLERGAQVNAQNEIGQTALHLAALNGRVHIVKVLLAEGADPRLLDRYGRSPMQCAGQPTDEHARCTQLLEDAAAGGGGDASVSGGIDGADSPCKHELVRSLHGLPSSAFSGRQAAANLA